MWIVAAHSGSHTGRVGEREQRVAHEAVLGEASDGEHRRRLELDPVREIDALQNRRDLVLAVRAHRPDDEREVELRRGRRAAHRSAAARRTNVSGVSASARTAGES